MSSINPPAVAMDVDAPANGPGTLKRCSSAPMINEGNTIMATANPSTSTSRDQQPFNLFGSSTQTRTRRFSASSSPGSPVSGLLTPRINQLRQEEQVDVSNLREVAHERGTHQSMQISQSWEDLSLMNESNESTKNSAKMGPLHVTLPSFNCNSPTHSSPTRLSSPGFQSPTRTPRTFVRRSASPVLRPSPLGAKRKIDDDKLDIHHMSPRAKRVHSYTMTDRGGLLTTTSNSLPGSLSSVGTPESLSSADSPGFNNFRSVDSPSPSRAMPVEPMMLSKSDHDMTEGPS